MTVECSSSCIPLGRVSTKVLIKELRNLNLCIFDLVVSNVIFLSFSAFVLKWHVSRKRLVAEQNSEIWDSGLLSMHMGYL